METTNRFCFTRVTPTTVTWRVSGSQRKNPLHARISIHRETSVIQLSHVLMTAAATCSSDYTLHVPHIHITHCVKGRQCCYWQQCHQSDRFYTGQYMHTWTQRAGLSRYTSSETVYHFYHVDTTWKSPCSASYISQCFNMLLTPLWSKTIAVRKPIHKYNSIQAQKIPPVDHTHLTSKQNLFFNTQS